MVAVGVCSAYPLICAIKWSPEDFMCRIFALLFPVLTTSLVGVYFFKSQKLVAFRNYMIAATLGFFVGATALTNVYLQLEREDTEAESGRRARAEKPQE
jgi:hypothetical protein